MLKLSTIFAMCLVSLGSSLSYSATNQFQDYISCYRALGNEARVFDGFPVNGVGVIRAPGTQDTYLIMANDGIYRQKFTPSTEMQSTSGTQDPMSRFTQAKPFVLKLPHQNVALEYTVHYLDDDHQKFESALVQIADNKPADGSVKVTANEDLSQANVKGFESDLKSLVSQVYSTNSNADANNLRMAQEQRSSGSEKDYLDRLKALQADKEKEIHALSTCKKVPALQDVVALEMAKYHSTGDSNTPALQTGTTLKAN